MMFYSLQVKCERRTLKRYQDLRKIDPYPVYFSYCEEEHMLELKYNGSSTSKQPGNCLLRHNLKAGGTFDYATSYPSEVNFSPALNRNEEMILLMEIARRRVVDKAHTKSDGTKGVFKDPWKKLPSCVLVSVIFHLTTQYEDFKEKFWIKSSEYHIFTGEDRTKKSKQLLLFFQSILNETQDVLLELQRVASNVLGLQFET